MSEEIKINTTGIKEGFSNAINFLKQKKVINIIILILLLTTLIGSSLIRTQNLPLLKDATTGKYIPLALDPYYFLRLAETINEQGSLPAVDTMRYPAAGVGFTNEITYRAVLAIHKIGNLISDMGLQFADVLYPVIFFALGLIVFFLLVHSLTKSKTTALISSIFLAVIPSYLYRTMAGFADHEPLGMFAFFLTLLAYSLSMKFLDKQKIWKKKFSLNLKNIILFSLILGFFTAFTFASWGGIANFVFMIIPLSFGLFWLIKTKNPEIKKKQLKNYLWFYLAWIVFSVLFTSLYGFSISSILNKTLLGSSSLINGFVLLFILSDFSIINFKDRINFIKKENLGKYRILYSFLIVLIIGIIFMSVYKQGIFSYISEIFGKLLHPFGTGRTGLTVAENKQPFLNNWQAQTGKIFFWLFFGGLITIGIKFSEKIKQNKNRFFFVLFWILMMFGILFSKVSSNSLFNGTNFISRLFYFGSLILFFGIIFWIYFNDKINLKSEQTILFSWLFFMLISARGAIRFFFLITPFVCFSAGFFIINILKYAKKSKDDMLKMILFIILILAIIGALFSFNNFISATSQQAKYTGPSANIQWQKAMSWVRANTLQESIFVHWWDYGYWVQYLGERATVTDGGHAIGYWDHLIGRYLLTTPKPETALSFMKTHDVNYLLLDPTDIGKYGAYSKIGSGKEGTDRVSSIPTMFPDESQTQKTENTLTRFYQGIANVDEDIIYKSEGQEIFLPRNKAFVIGTVLQIKNDEIQQPRILFIYNNQQIYIPVRYVYLDNKIIDFGGGLNASVYIMPRIVPSENNFQMDKYGTILYLSPKVSESLFAQLYLFDDAFDKYSTIELAHSEEDPFIGSLESYGTNLEDIVYYNGVRGPIKIFKVDYPNNIIEREEFLRTSGEYAEFDNLEFVK